MHPQFTEIKMSALNMQEDDEKKDHSPLTGF